MKKVMKLFTLLFFFKFAFINGATSNTKHYIVYMGHPSHADSDSAITANHGLLASVIGSYEGAQEASVQHYTKSFRGFSAMLTPNQAQKLAERESVVSVFESRMNELHTTHSWGFLGVNSNHQYKQLIMDSKSDLIVGIVDTGVWPESQSFNDYGLGPVPTRFKGKCITGDNFTMYNCNRKIIGARFYSKGFEAENGPLELSNATFFRSARDSDGHGTHTASTVAGSMVTNTSLLGIAKGTARGGAPSARLSIYKACWFNLCSDADILSAMDDAINDGVDIISLSLGPVPPQPSYFEDAISIASFHAFQRRVVVSASAGNNAFAGTATNVAPWILTVAASTTDRELRSYLYLGNTKIITGFGLNPTEELNHYYGLIAGSAAAASGVPPRNASFCKENTLDPTLIKGKIVVCTIESPTDARAEKGDFVRQGGGVGIILIDPVAANVAFQFVVQQVSMGVEEAKVLLAYMATDKNPVGRISQTKTVLSTKPAPKMAVFSSMGPNLITPDIIKPDITAPGVNILAAWSPLATKDTAERTLEYNIISGTSMSCPHVSAVAAILKSFHPLWSPAAIKSAIMTTANIIDNTQNIIRRDPNGSPTTPFDYGSGHINPLAALNPGLIYDFDSYDIINFLCSIGASPSQLKNLTNELVSCKTPVTPSYDFNYPSIGVSNMKGNLSVQRTVTYYGKGPTVYFPKIDYPSGVNVSVTPSQLKFTRSGDKMSFSVNFTPYKGSNGSFVFGALIWRNGVHNVRSPIALNVA